MKDLFRRQRPAQQSQEWQPKQLLLGPSCYSSLAYNNGPQGEVIRINNHVRLVRDADMTNQAQFDQPFVQRYKQTVFQNDPT